MSERDPGLGAGVSISVARLPRDFDLQDDELTGAAGAAAAAELSSPEEVPEMCRMATPPSAIVRRVTRATIILSRVDMLNYLIRLLPPVDLHRVTEGCHST